MQSEAPELHYLNALKNSPFIYVKYADICNQKGDTALLIDSAWENHVALKKICNSENSVNINTSHFLVYLIRNSEYSHVPTLSLPGSDLYKFNLLPYVTYSITF